MSSKAISRLPPGPDGPSGSEEDPESVRIRLAAGPRGWLVQDLPPWSVRGMAAALAVGIVLGLAVVLVGPIPTLLGVLGLAVAGLAFAAPELVILLVLAFGSGLIPSRLNLFIDLRVGSLQISDLLLLWLLFIVVLRAVMEREWGWRRTAMDVPLLLFFGSIVMGLGTAVIGFGVSFSDATYEVRTLMQYLVFFAVTNLVRTQAQTARLAVGAIGIGVLIAATMLAQSSQMAPEWLTESWTIKGRGVVRSFHPGFSAVYVVLTMVGSYVALRPAGKPRWFLWPLILLLAMGLLATLARNLLVAGAISGAVLLLAWGRRERAQFWHEMLLLVTVIAAVAGVVAAIAETPSMTDYATAYVARIERMFSSEILSRSENLYSRWEEAEFALEKLATSPVLGIGLYSPYRPAFYKDEDPTLRHFIHNAYLGLWLKTGLLGLGSFLWLSARFLLQGFQQLPTVRDRFLRAMALGSLAAYVGLMFSNVVAPSFIQPTSLAIFGLILGLNEAIWMNAGEKKELPKGKGSGEHNNVRAYS